MASVHTFSIIVKNLGKYLAFCCTLGLEIPEGQDNEHHAKFTSKNGYNIGFTFENTTLQTNLT